MFSYAIDIKVTIYKGLKNQFNYEFQIADWSLLPSLQTKNLRESIAQDFQVT